MVLPRSRIDILKGPETANLIYIGEAEEKRLKLRSYATQLEDLARKNAKKANAKFKCASNACGHTDCMHTQQADAEILSDRSNSSSFRGKTKAVLTRKPVIADGHACVGEHNWTVLKRTPFVLKPLANECYVTTAALAGCPQGQ